ncbi:MAG: amidohydrolase family protein [Bryobacteraceae bacterium]|nr:amidohydrolase family protein [Bryobacteraceae bacterium]
MIRRLLLPCLLPALLAQSVFTPGTQPFIRYQAPVIALTHVRVIDGTGAPAVEDQTVVIRQGRIAAIGTMAAPEGALVVDLKGHTVIPGLVGMHEHLFYPSRPGVPLYTEHALSFPRLYLASGVTTARTAGTLEPVTDLNTKKLIDAGRMPGPKMLITVGYLEGPGSFAVQMPELKTPEDARAFVDYWSSQGAHSFKAYMNISRAALKAAIDAAHARGKQLTGHLCSVGFREAAAMGIDNLEHGILTDVEHLPAKQPDLCLPGGGQIAEGETQRAIIADLVARKVAITSTLAVFEVAPPLQQRFLDVLAPHAALNYLAARDRISPEGLRNAALRVEKEQAFERAFVAAGGLLVAGCDPTGNGSAMAGFGDQRNIVLLVAAGFTPLEAIRIATLNGAKLLKLDAEIGSLAVGKAADIAVIEGDPSRRIADIENVRFVFKDGIGYDSAKLLESVKGRVGIH